MGISPVFVRTAEVGPFASAFWRVGLALPLLWLWLLWEVRSTGVTIRSVMRFDMTILLAGTFFAGDLFFWHLAILNTSITNATLLSCLAPVWVALFSGAFIGEAVGKNVFSGLGLCLIGAVLLVGGGNFATQDNLWGDLYGVITSIFFGLYFLVIRVARRSEGAGALTFKSTAVTAAILFLIALIIEPTLLPQTIKGAAALLALGLFSHTGGQGLLAVALGSLSAAFSSLVIFVEALAAAVFAWLLLSEPVTIFQTIGGSLILAGIWVARPRAS